MGHPISGARRRTIGAAAVATVAILSVAGCGGDDDPVADPAAAAADDAAIGAAADDVAKPAYGLVTPDQAAELAAAGVTVIDVRTPEEYAEGHVEGAQVIDFYSDTFAQDVAKLDPNDEYLVYCRSGNRSGQAVAIMQQAGIDQIWDLDGGVVGAAGSSLTLVR